LEQDWRCSEDNGHAFRLRKGDRNWRMLGFTKGFAEYKDVSPKAAEQFDQVIDSLCYQPLK
jgi:hypothetical protein